MVREGNQVVQLLGGRRRQDDAAEGAVGEVLRALVLLASDDATIRDALTNELRKGG